MTDRIGGPGWTVRIGESIVRDTRVSFEPDPDGEYIEAWTSLEEDAWVYVRRRGHSIAWGVMD